jgi:DegV family protein with EDD domain
MNYKIICDSSSNLRPAAAHLAAVPLKIVTDKKEYTDDETLDVASMLLELESYKGRSGTSCPNVADWLEAFGEAQWVFAVAITSNLSGSYNAAVQAKQAYEEEHPGRRVCCLDTLSTAGEMVLIQEKLEQLIAQGLSFEEVEAAIREYMHHTHLGFMLERMDNLAKNGRVSPIVAKACGILNIRIVGCASDVGTLQPDHKCRGTKKALETIVKDMVEKGYRGGKVILDHVYNPDAAQALKEKILAQFPEADIRIGLCGGLCCFYAEQGGLLVGYES